ncbi:hypothetical protein [Lysobacter panacisoli]|uniref:Uncharacterized protein n=1 Tax=Lysobacter panacisoli TaxID=1255263 RepID=A0ABP9LFY3_9GAMM|nr:hypothetical protein [Lysobacter panacisoli]
MIRAATALALLASGFAFAGELSHKSSYSAQSLKERGIVSVQALVGEYASSNRLTLDPHKPTVFLIDGKYQMLSAEERDSALVAAGSVEVMSDGEAVVVDVRN